MKIRRKNAREILANLGQNIDVVCDIFDGIMLDMHRRFGFELSRESLYCAVSIHYKLAVKERLHIQNLYDKKELRPLCRYMMRYNLWKSHGRIHIIDFAFYNMEIFNCFENRMMYWWLSWGRAIFPIFEGDSSGMGIKHSFYDM